MGIGHARGTPAHSAVDEPMGEFMGIRNFVLLVFALLASGTLCSNAQWKKYEVKSGIITYETISLEGRVHVSGKVVLYFDQYGALECKDVYVGGILKESAMCDGRVVYSIIHDQRTVFKLGPATTGTEVRFDWDAMPVPNRAERQIKRLPNMTVAGKLCEVYEQSSPGGKTKYAGWGHILLLLERNLSDNQYMMKAESFVETNQVPESKFVPPPGYTERLPHF